MHPGDSVSSAWATWADEAGPLAAPSVGLGLKAEFADNILTDKPALGFFEVHAENYLVAGGPRLAFLEQIRQDYPLSIHGVSLSIGGTEALDADHLKGLRQLLDRFEPALFSEHLAWSTHDGVYLNDLLPLPYNATTLARVCAHIDHAQEALGRSLLLENPSTYVMFAESSWDEPDFMAEVVRRTGCGLLLDINNIYVSCTNHGLDTHAYLHAMPLHATGEIHLAGFDEQSDSLGEPLLIDHHGAAVDEAVWRLYCDAIERLGPRPVLIERDNNIPALAELLAEAQRAERVLYDSLAHA